MKKIFIIILALLTVLLFINCDPNNGDSGDSGDSGDGGGETSFTETFESSNLNTNIWGGYYTSANYPANSTPTSAEISTDQAQEGDQSLAMPNSESLSTSPHIVLNVTIPTEGAQLKFWYYSNQTIDEYFPNANYYGFYDNVTGGTEKANATISLDERNQWVEVTYELTEGAHDLMWKSLTLFCDGDYSQEIGFLDNVSIVSNGTGEIIVNTPAQNPNN
jgi:hypothetical protein